MNFIHNASLEDTICTGSSISCVQYWYIVQITPDFCSISNGYVPNNPAGHQWPHHGNVYGGEFVLPSVGDIPPEKREYMGVGLTQTLEAGKHYCCEFWVNLPDGSSGTPGAAIDRLGAYFSPDSLASGACCVLAYTPQVENPAGNIITDTANWTLISGEFVAQGTEKFMIVGNFKDNATTQKFYFIPGTASYYFFDDFSLVLIPDISYPKDFADAGGDKSFCAGDSAQLGTPATPGCHYTWQPATGLDNDTLAQPTVSPIQTTTYILTVQTYSTACRPALTLTDTVMVVIDDCAEPEQPIEIYNIFTPNGDTKNDVFFIKNLPANSALQIFNRWGGRVYESSNYNNKWDGDDVPEGTYYYILTLQDKETYHGFVELRR